MSGEVISMNINFLQDSVSLLMTIILNSMIAHGVVPCDGTNLVAYFLHLIQQAATQAAL
jgi:hypothetical protein